MRVEIGYCIVLLSRVMGLRSGGYLETWMVQFIEWIKASNPIDWGTSLSNSIHDHLVSVLIEPKFYMPSYIVYLLVPQHPNYPKLTKRGNMQDPRAWTFIVYP